MPAWIMKTIGLLALIASYATGFAAEEGSAPQASGAPVVPAAASPASDKASARVWVIPVREQIAKPVLYVIRRGLKQAEAAGATAVVLDMNTPGGELGVTLKIMEALDKFSGETLVYVNQEAISAGAIISSVADEIHFAPKGIIGAAAAVSGGGEEIPETMKQKLKSYMAAKVESFTQGKTYRAEVIKAMMDTDYELKVGDTVIKPKGELLTLTDVRAGALYGTPPVPLLSAGTHETLEAMLDSKYGKNGYTVSRLQVTWSEELASWLNAVSPILMGLGLLAVYIEFKTPGFGVFGIAGGLLLALVFFGHYAAGLSGHMPALVFILGVALVAVEIFLVPGTLVAGLSGAALMLGALAWSMLDVWPDKLPSFDAETLTMPVLNVMLSVVVAVVTALALGRFLPRGWFWDKMVLNASVTADAGTPPQGMGGGLQDEVLVHEGSSGVTVSALRPMGEVEVGGRRYEARADLGSLERGETVRVVGRSGRTLIVARAK